MPGKHSLDNVDPGRSAVPAGQVSISSDILAALEEVEAQDVWLDAWRTLEGNRRIEVPAAMTRPSTCS